MFSRERARFDRRARFEESYFVYSQGMLDLGDVPTWLATAGASVAAYFAYRAYKIESGRDAEAASLRRRDQASRVAIWRTTRDHPHSLEPDVLECFVIRNASQLPLYDTQVFSYSYKYDNPEDVSPDAVFTLDTVAPAEKPELHIAHESRTKMWVYAIQFTDAAGLVWHRDRRGVLCEAALPHADQFTDQYLMDDDF